MVTIFLLSISVSVHADSQIAHLIKTIEYQYDIPSGLLLALADVESNYQPYSLNISGKSVISNSVEQAKNIAEQYLQKGKQNIDIGVMQLNYFWHGKNFTSIAEMLTPKKNINYAAQLLTSLYKQHGSWHKAVRHYHSRNPKYHRQYSRKVLVAWLKSDRQINSR
ncbi:MAG: lytic transglycosylase domain-containing protein (plasmid) [Rickettsia endosymbiont of Culicoides impunctatus]|nr:MAG: lytic transglycosylase domain-containing protein [Rickettsia endosymbiont of Culicoides impunctatus]